MSRPSQSKDGRSLEVNDVREAITGGVFRELARCQRPRVRCRRRFSESLDGTERGRPEEELARIRRVLRKRGRQCDKGIFRQAWLSIGGQVREEEAKAEFAAELLGQFLLVVGIEEIRQARVSR